MNEGRIGGEEMIAGIHFDPAKREEYRAEANRILDEVGAKKIAPDDDRTEAIENELITSVRKLRRAEKEVEKLRSALQRAYDWWDTHGTVYREGDWERGAQQAVFDEMREALKGGK